jgi:hypothetical protein
MKVEKPVERKRLVVTLHQTDNEKADITQLHQLMAILQEYPGDDEVSLVVSNGIKIFKLKMGQIRVGYGEDLKRRLTGLVGEDGLGVEPI